MDELRIESGSDLLLTLLYTPGTSGRINEPIRGITKLEKLMFLLEKETDFKELMKEYDFKSDNFGPCSIELYDIISSLEEMGLVKRESIPTKSYNESVDQLHINDEMIVGEAPISGVKNVEIFKLTDDGRTIAENLIAVMNEKQRKQLERIKSLFNSMPLNRLISYVYNKYPEYTDKSIIRDKYLK